MRTDKEQIEEVISQMDWEMIRKVMVSLNWEYWDRGIPSIDILKDTARMTLLQAMLIEGGECESGGFLARRIDITDGYYLELHFAIDSANNYNYFEDL